MFHLGPALIKGAHVVHIWRGGGPAVLPGARCVADGLLVSCSDVTSKNFRKSSHRFSFLCDPFGRFRNMLLFIRLSCGCNILETIRLGMRCYFICSLPFNWRPCLRCLHCKWQQLANRLSVLHLSFYACCYLKVITVLSRFSLRVHLSGSLKRQLLWKGYIYF